MKDKKLSMFLSLVLRHKPDTIGLKLDDGGWANTQELIKKMNDHNIVIGISTLKHIVKDNNKKRFIFSTDKKRIRANQGHSINVNLGLKPIKPPDTLYHGTAIKFIDSIKKDGISKQQRNHVHLSHDFQTAIDVGSRHGEPVVLEINAKEMAKDKFPFFKSENDVWLTDLVPIKYIRNFKDYGEYVYVYVAAGLMAHIKAFRTLYNREPAPETSICKRITHNKYENKKGEIIEAGGCHEENDFDSKDSGLNKLIKSPFNYDPNGQMIFDGDENLLLDVRGWGMFQYHENGEAFQNEFGELVTELLNKHFQE